MNPTGALRLPTPESDGMPRQERPAEKRIVGLDGLRALAVAAVVAYHPFPHGVPGGFIGVDVFFVVSGYLITRTFVHDLESHGRGLGHFYRRRARRILPAMLGVLLATVTAAGLVGGNAVSGILPAAVGAVTFTSNWVAIAQSASYFASTSAHPLQHLWSLAVEEQFYLVWPLVLMALHKVSRRLQCRAAVLLAVVSAAAMAISFRTGADPTPVYVGTFTHAFGLALGSALALHQKQRPAAETPATQSDRVARLSVGLVVLVGLSVSVLHLPDTSPWTYRGGLFTIDLAVATLIWSLASGRPGLGKVLDCPPLRYIGQRSYAIYLWHWPILVLLTSAFRPRGVTFMPLIAVLTVTLSTAAAIASYRWVEQPILRKGYRHTVRDVVHALTPRTAVMASALTVLLLLGCWHALTLSERPSDAEALIRHGQDFLHDQSRRQTPPVSVRPSKTPEPTPALAPTATATPTQQQTTAAPPSVPLAQQPITAIGDSVMLAAAPTLTKTFPQIRIDAEVSRQPATALTLLRDQAARGTLADTVVIGLGTNGYLGQGTLNGIRTIIGPTRTLILVTTHADRPWTSEVNSDEKSFASTHPRTFIADWNRAISSRPDLLAADGIHPGASGANVYSSELANALKQVP